MAQFPTTSRWSKSGARPFQRRVSNAWRLRAARAASGRGGSGTSRRPTGALGDPAYWLQPPP
eukprot:13208958-Heterocapsa_arctica.AAC.1